MAKKNKTEDQFVQVEEALSKTEQFIEDNHKVLIKIVGGIITVIALVSIYKNFYIEPMEKEAQIESYMAELYFQKDSFNLALNGDGQYAGFLDVADEYGATNIGKLANYYAGLCYLNTGDYESAIEYLEKFSCDDIILTSLAKGCTGDAYMELGDRDEAMDAYKDAIDNSDNAFTAPRYMMKLAMIHELNEDFDDALELYQDIKKNYKKSREASDIEKYISRAENR